MFPQCSNDNGCLFPFIPSFPNFFICFHNFRSTIIVCFPYFSSHFPQLSLNSREFFPIIFHHIFPHTPHIFPYLSVFSPRSSPPVSTQAAEISALCACVDAHVALGDVGAPQGVGKPWENHGKTMGKPWEMEMFQRKSAS